MKAPSPANWQRVFGCLLILVQASALAYYFHTFLFSVVAGLVAILTTFWTIRLNSPKTLDRLPLILPVLFVIQQAFLPDSLYTDVRSFLLPGACLIAEYFVIYQVALCLLLSNKDRLPSYFPVLAITSMVFTGDVSVNPYERWGFQVLSLLLVLLIIAFYYTSRSRSKTDAITYGNQRRFTAGHLRWLIAVGSLCCVAGWASASGLYKYARQIEATINSFVQPSIQPNAAGFSGRGRIGSVAEQKGTAGDSVAIRVFSSQLPGYLRGKVFGTYEHGQWKRDSSKKTVSPSTEKTHETIGFQNDEIFRLGKGKNLATKEPQEVWPAQNFHEVLFTPLGVSAIQAPLEKVSVDGFGVVSAEAMLPNTRYFIWPRTTENDSLRASPDLTDTQRSQLTALPDDLDPRITELAQTVLGDAVTTAYKIASVENYFLDNYQYRFGIDIPNERDPIEYFLLERPPAHCEYFASGAILLLRSAGVPCRYVTGFVSAEKNEIGGYWVARNRDAHAWVEAFDQDNGWVVVETTPPSGTPQTSTVPSSTADQMWDATKSRWQRLVASIRAGGLSGMLRILGPLLIHPLTIALVILSTFVLVLRRLRIRRGPAESQETADPQIQQMHALLSRMDKRWDEEGITRQPQETLHQFAGRLDTAGSTPEFNESARWYRRFAAIRYSGQINLESIETLGSSLHPNDI